MLSLEKKCGLGNFLVNKGILSKEQLQKTIDLQKSNKNKRIGEIIREINFLGEEELLKQLAEYLQVDFVILSEMDYDLNNQNLFSKSIMLDWGFAPFKFEESIINVAVNDVYNFELCDKIKNMARGYDINFYLSLESMIINFIKESYARSINHYEFKGRKERFGEFLIRRGIITTEQLEFVLSEQQKYLDKRTGELLCQMGILSQEEILVELAAHLKKDYILLNEIQPDKKFLSFFEPSFMLKNHVVPFDIENDCIKIAAGNILDFELIEIIEEKLNKNNLKVHFYIALNYSIQIFIEHLLTL